MFDFDFLPNFHRFSSLSPFCSADDYLLDDVDSGAGRSGAARSGAGQSGAARCGADRNGTGGDGATINGAGPNTSAKAISRFASFRQRASSYFPTIT